MQESTRSWIGEAGPGRKPLRRDPAAELVIELVAELRAVSPRLLLHRSRCRSEVSAARHVAMYLMHVALGRSLGEVGRFFGRDRSTVSYACGRVEDLREQAVFDAELDRLETRIGAEGEGRVDASR